ncbi:MAG: LLM class flavin-dependent oxidoreductase [Actinobacteria bacterium]|nr:LLM class flavin-dependent oxidoreductase [Actinomycetota bacterium]
MNLSVLDLASVYEGMSNGEALRQTIATAQEAERLGYRRFWVAEHHGMPAIASSAPPVLIGAIAAATSTIRVGSGGVMLPNHSSLVVAEQFGTLAALYGDRIDLGLGRAPGTDPLTTSVLRRGATNETVDDFPNQVIELLAWFGTISPLENGIGSRVVAVPGLGDSPELWLLGSSDFSARLAGLMGLPFAFAHHFAGGPNTRTAFDVYRESFTPSVVLREPHSMVAVAALVSDEAERLMLPGNLGFVRMRQGARPSRIPTLAEAEAHPWSEAELAWVAERNSQQAIGTLDHVQERIADLVAVTRADEVIVVPQGPDLDTKLATLRSLV